jgi:hypothetical protein
MYCRGSRPLLAPLRRPVTSAHVSLEPRRFERTGNSNALVPMATVAGVPPFHSGRTHAERYASGAGNSWSEERAEAISSRLHALVRCGPDWDRAPHGLSTLRGVWAGGTILQLRPRLLPYSLHRGAEPDMVGGREGSSYQVRLAPLGLLGRRFQPEMMPQRRAGIVEPVQAAPL